jgi:Alw26I/Eco31I/Esp3I family type II restriction endonuclease
VLPSNRNNQKATETTMTPLYKEPPPLPPQRNNYENYIRNHDNYQFIPKDLRLNWVAVSKEGVNPRREHWDIKLKELISSGELPEGSTLTNVARFIHPNKKHICKICNQECSIFYEYPTKNTWKWISKNFDITKNEENKSYTIFQLFHSIENTSKSVKFTKYFGISIVELEKECHNDIYNGKKLSPGVMGNPPDRLDGFHCYNSICDCRKTKDKGRGDKNMKSYTRDRRAYEMMSDGRVLLANRIMGELNKIKSICFMCHKEKKMTADHIGPISLGFIHDPNNFQGMCSPCNSKKNNRLAQEDIDKIKSIELTGKTMVSWWANNCWTRVKNSDFKEIQNALNKNAKKMLSIIKWLKENKQDILREFINTHYLEHEASYKIGKIEILSNGIISYTHTSYVSTKKTKITQKKRTIEILLEQNDKTNRKNKIQLTDAEIECLTDIDISTFKSKICKVLEGL